MNETVRQKIREMANQLVRETGSLSDATPYIFDMAEDINSQLGLDYPMGSDSFGVLYKECHSEVWHQFHG